MGEPVRNGAVPSRLVFWQYCLSPHQAPLIRALADRPGIEAVLIAQEGVPAQRQAMGWSTPHFGGASVFVAPDRSLWTEMALADDPSTLHIFSPARAYPLIWQAFTTRADARQRCAILSEQFDWHGIKGKLRLGRGRLDRRRYGPFVDFVLGIGHTGVHWFRRCGFPEEQIYPFGYFVEDPPPAVPLEPESDPRGPVRVIFVGTLSRQKGVDLLLRALRHLPRAEWRLEVVGDGQEWGRLANLAARSGLGDRVSFVGQLPDQEVRSRLEQADLLVLPSRHKEGWGAVISESLMAGTPVVCSDLCGAADLLGSPLRGETFRSGSVASLRAVLQNRLALGPVPPERRAAIRSWSRSIRGDSAADFLLRVLESVYAGAPRPRPPWFP